jgi:hypothetical protein
MVFYLLTGFALAAIVFLVMVSVQLFKIEKAVSDITHLTEHRVKKIYEKD